MKNYFSPDELKCKCGCGLNNFSPILLSFINEIRRVKGHPLMVTSGCRCPMHNTTEGGKPTSDHITGEGIDLKALTSRDRFIIIHTALSLGITRVGIAKTFIHLGINAKNPQMVIWRY